MDAALDSPLEALAINYLAYGFLTAVNNIWAWIAVVTAAVSFWRMRALSSPSSSTPELRTSRSHDAGTYTSTAQPAAGPATVPTTNGAPVTPALDKAPCRVLEREGSVKMKYSLYYEEEEEEEEQEEEGGGGGGGGGGGVAVRSGELGKWRDGWERMMVMRMGDMGWYRGQNRMVLDGSVVRLWEGRGLSPRHAAARVVGGGVAW